MKKTIPGTGWTGDDIHVLQAEFPGEVRYADPEGRCLLHLVERNDYFVTIEAFYIGSVESDDVGDDYDTYDTFRRHGTADRVLHAWWKLDGCVNAEFGDRNTALHQCDGLDLVIETTRAANRWAHQLLAESLGGDLDWSAQ